MTSIYSIHLGNRGILKNIDLALRLEAGKLAVSGELDGFDVLREHGVFDVIFTLDKLCCHAQSADVFQSVETVE